MTTTYDPFVPTDGLVSDADHVRVERRVSQAADGVSVRYIKTFKASSGYDYSWFTTHEVELLLDFKHNHLSRVVQMAEMRWSAINAINRVETLDAGPSLFHWMQLRPLGKDGRATPHPLAAPQAFFLVMRAALLALNELFVHRYVHCDIDTRNLCLPFVRHPVKTDMFIPDWNGLRLIDFAYSLGESRPLRMPLPIRPDASLHSQEFMRALDADHREGNTRNVRRLDGRIDLFALGLMAQRMLVLLEPGWRDTPHASEAGQAARALVAGLRAQDSTPGWPAESGLHERLLAPVDSILRLYGGIHEPTFQLAGALPTHPRRELAASRDGPDRARRPTIISEASPIAQQPVAAITPLSTVGVSPAASTSTSAPAPTPLRTPTGAAAQTPLRQATPAAEAAPVVRVSPPMPAPMRRPQASHPAPSRTAPQTSPATSTQAGVAPVIGPSPNAAVAARAQAIGTTSRSVMDLPRLPSSTTQHRSLMQRVWPRLGDMLTLERWRRAAARGEAEACYRMGLLLLRAIAIPADPVTALRWFAAAAEQGHVAAQSATGTCYDEGIGTAPDPALAWRWYMQAAAGGDARARYGLGILLIRGRPVARDDVAAAGHLLAAAEAGIAEAFFVLGQLILWGEGVVHHRGDAINCFRQGFALKHLPCALMLGRLYEQPPAGELPDPQTAKLWYERARSWPDIQRIQAMFPS